jgi:NitT/TauT family transport system permease protein
MSRIHVPFAPPVEEEPETVSLSSLSRAKPVRPRTRPQFVWWVDVIVIAALIALAYGLVMATSRWTAPLTPSTQISLSPLALPVYAAFSTLRMSIAYVISLVFSLIYARIAATYRPAEKVMIPLLDILQSIPILSFLPVVLLGLIALFPHSNIGLELAAIVLIFTSQAWNMTFSFYHSLLIIPEDLSEAASIYRLNTWQRFVRLELPFGMIPLIWNSMMSWAGGWFFLLAAEQFSLGANHNFQLPGLGSYLQTAANQGNVGAMLLGLLTLVVVIVLLDQFLWRPLIAWADRFKVEQTAGGTPPQSWVLTALRRSALVDSWNRRVIAPAAEGLDRLSTRLLPDPSASSSGNTLPRRRRQGATVVRRAASVILLVVILALVAIGVVSAAGKVLTLPPGEWLTILESAGATLLRTAAALAIGVAWTVPVGVTIGLSPRLASRAQPLVQMVASIPATALFPALLLILLRLPGGLDLAAVALMLLGTQWYVLFNVIAGAMSIPSDLRECGLIYKLRGWRRWRVLILPAIFPSLITGMITATGGAWNASVVSEYVSFQNHTYTTVGLGSLIAQAVNSTPVNYSLLLASTLMMAAVVVTINRLVWRPLYRLAEQRFHLD